MVKSAPIKDSATERRPTPQSARAGVSIAPPNYGISVADEAAPRAPSTEPASPASQSRTNTQNAASRKPRENKSSALRVLNERNPEFSSDEVPSSQNTAAGKKKEGLGDAGQALLATSQAVVEENMKNIETLSSHQQKTKRPKTKVLEAKAAVVPPEEEGKAEAKKEVVDTVDKSSKDLKAPPTSRVQGSMQGFPGVKDLFDIPETGSDLKAYMDRSYHNNISTGDVKEKILNISGIGETFGSIPQEPVIYGPPLPPGPPIPGLERAKTVDTMNLGQGLIGELDDAFLDMSEDKKFIDQKFEEEGLYPDRLDLIDSGELLEAKMQKEFISKHVKEGPKKIKEDIQKEKQRTYQNLTERETKARKEMGESRKAKLLQSKKRQKTAKDEITRKRQTFSDKIKSQYTFTKGEIDKKLGKLEEEHIKPFAKFLREGPPRIESFIRGEINEIMEKRHSGISGFFVHSYDYWFTDKADLPASKAAIKRWTNHFKNQIKTKSEALNTEISLTIQSCRSLITTAQTNIDNEAKKRGTKITEEESKALSNIRQKLHDLREDVQKSEQELGERVQTMRQEAIQNLDNRIEKMREEMSSAVSKAVKFVKKGALKLFKLVLEKLGINPDPLIDIIGKVFSVLWKIVKSPGRFIKNLIAAGKKGLFDFVEGIGGYIKEGLFEWIKGFLGDLNIKKLPDRFNLQGISSVAFQVLGLTWANIRAKLARPENLGEETMSKLESGVEGARKLITGLRQEGPMYLFHLVEDKAIEIKQKITESLKSWAIVNLVKKGVTEFIKFLIPGGGFARSVLAIYDTIMFFWHNRGRIMAFMKSVFNTIGSIANGNIAVAAKGVTNTLAKTIPMILSFFARLLRIDGVGKAMKRAVDKVKRPVDRILNKIVGYISNVAKKLFEKGKLLVNKGKEKLKAGASKIMNWWRMRKKFKDKSGASHSLYFEGKGGSAELMVASTPQLVTDLLNQILQSDGGKEVASKVRGKLKMIYNRKLQISSGAKKEQEKNQRIAAEIESLVVEISDLLSSVNLGGRKSFPSTTLNFSKPPGYSRYPSELSEYRRQLKEQESAMNSMTITKWMTNRYVFEKQGERIPDENLRLAENKKFLNFADFKRMQLEKYDKEISKNLSAEEKEQIKRPSDAYIREMWQYERAATHRLDQIAGGDHYDFSGVGDSYINSHIGGQWRSKNHVKTLTEVVEKIDPSVHGKVKMNVKLNLK